MKIVILLALNWFGTCGDLSVLCGTVGGNMPQIWRAMSSRMRMSFSFLCWMLFMRKCRRISAGALVLVRIGSEYLSVYCSQQLKHESE